MDIFTFNPNFIDAIYDINHLINIDRKNCKFNNINLFKKIEYK
jgi:hypothetical protein